ncbi:MAG: hypothetical protein ACPL3Q_09920 [Candidatus Ratteibacteria bacterium]
MIGMWKLERPKPKLPISYFWTWDHSTNWVLDDPGLLTWGCNNKYLKKPETFVEDYKRLIDFSSGIGVKGIVIWGFLRDSHGGVEYSKKVVDYALSKGIAIMPGIGTTAYGGVYYEGEHKYNLDVFLKKNPDAGMVYEDGQFALHAACPSHRLFREWLQEGIVWLFKQFEIGGANLENGDFLVCHDTLCRSHKERWPGDEPDFFRLQSLSYEPALKCIENLLSEKIVTYATYSGFVPGFPPDDLASEKAWDVTFMRCKEPAMISRLPKKSIGQWTLTSMVRKQPLPLTAYLDHGAPKEVFDNPYWPEGIKAPGKRNVGFIHQGSQWRGDRYSQVVSTIKEACLRGYRSKLEGICIHGEVSSRHIPSALNYLAFSHFVHYPEDSLREFGRKTLGQVLGSEDEGEMFAEIFAHWDAGTLSESHKKQAKEKANDLAKKVAGNGTDLERWRFWNWLLMMVSNVLEKHTVSFF